jgi:hypothetical protein
MGEDPATAPPETTTPAEETTPWYATPATSILNMLGNITYREDEYTIQTVDGALIIDRRTPTTTTSTTTPTTPTAAGGYLQMLGRIPAYVWIAAGGLVLFGMVRR